MKTRMTFFVNLSSVHGKARAFSLKMTKTRLNKINFHFCSGIYKFGLELHCSWINVEKKTLDKTVYQHFPLSQVELTSAEGSGRMLSIFIAFSRFSFIADVIAFPMKNRKLFISMMRDEKLIKFFIFSKGLSSELVQFSPDIQNEMFQVFSSRRLHQAMDLMKF